MNATTALQRSARFPRHFAKWRAFLCDTWLIPTSCPPATRRSLIELHSPPRMPGVWPKDQRTCLFCRRHRRAVTTGRGHRPDSIPIALPSARRFSPKGFLANRTRKGRRTSAQMPCAAPAGLKTLCIIMISKIGIRIMKAMAVDLLEWEKRFGTEEACGEAQAKQRRPEEFRCPRCGHDHGYAISTRKSYDCSSCHYQASHIAGTLFHSTNLPLTKWFWAIYLMASDNGGISALRLAKQLWVSWATAHRMLRKIRIAIGHQDSSLSTA